jgi:hypothetical protein
LWRISIGAWKIVRESVIMEMIIQSLIRNLADHMKETEVLGIGMEATTTVHMKKMGMFTMAIGSPTRTMETLMEMEMKAIMAGLPK